MHDGGCASDDCVARIDPKAPGGTKSVAVVESDNAKSYSSGG
jgi:hypothetical protein